MGGCQHRHLAHQKQGRLFEQQREAAALAGPGNADPQHAVLRAVGAGDLGHDVAVMLKEIQMTPRDLGKVVRLAGLAARRAGEQAAALGANIEVEFVQLFAGIKPLADQPPRRPHPQPQSQNHIGVHVRPARPNMRQSASVLATVKDASRRSAMAYGHP